MPPKSFVLLLLLVSWLASGACQVGRETPTQLPQNQSPPRERVAGTRGGSLAYRIISPPKTFNYLLASDVDSLAVSFLLTGGRLAELDHDTQRYVPALAETWRLA
ncbi:MAG: hypothetical protein M3430_13735, partial [Acidobacteriota bacterium]|nr:hypothetical protein [Acidobacteriota bacterium]